MILQGRRTHAEDLHRHESLGSPGHPHELPGIFARLRCRKPPYVRSWQAASRAPSGGNLQPWYVDVLTGAPLAALVERVRAQVPEHPLGHHVRIPGLSLASGGALPHAPLSERGGPVRHHRDTARRPPCPPAPVRAQLRGLWRTRDAVHLHRPLYGVGAMGRLGHVHAEHHAAGAGARTAHLSRRNPGRGGTGRSARQSRCPPLACCSRASRWVTATSPRPSTGCAPSGRRWRNSRPSAASPDPQT